MRVVGRVMLAGAWALACHTVALPAAGQTMLGQMVSGHGYVGGIMLDNLYQFDDGTSVEQLSGMLVGGQFGAGITPSVSVFANVATTSTTMYLGAVDGASFGEAFGHDALLWDVSVQMRKPFWHEAAFNPLVQIGLGQIRTTTTPGWDSSLEDVRTAPLLSAGLGFDLQLVNALGLRVMAKDYYTTIAWENTSDARFNNAAVEAESHNIAYHVGVTLGF